MDPTNEGRNLRSIIGKVMDNKETLKFVERERLIVKILR